jgi:hypothetical protein
MSKSIDKTTGGVYETERSSIKLNFLNCNCQCCGEKQKYFPEKNFFSHEQFYSNMIKMLIKPHYALDCTCQCGPNRKQITEFSIDTGVLRFNQSELLKTTCNKKQTLD